MHLLNGVIAGDSGPKLQKLGLRNKKNRRLMSGACVTRWLRHCIICIPVFCLFATLSYAESRVMETAQVAVVYPEVGKPYQDVIDSIIQGIRQQTGSPLELFALKGGADSARLNAWLEQRKIKVVVALAKQGLEATDKLPDGMRRVLGALLLPPPQNDASYAGGISLAPDPEVVFERIRRLSPKTRRVVVVYDPASNDWMMELARPAASVSGLELVAVPARDLREAASAYAELQQKVLRATDLVWLLNDPNTVDTNTILPFLLRTSWSDGFAVISNNPSHVKRGVLFSLYPDYNRMGNSLGRFALQVAVNGDYDNKPMSPLKDVLIAVNLRTAEHLNLVFSQKEKDAFDLIFPESR
jgi:putative tryptophan/tyrosine transport system substrate-binding protein